MPHLNRSGDYVHGLYIAENPAQSSGASFNNVFFGHGGSPCWLNPTTAVFIEDLTGGFGGTRHVSSYNVNTHAITLLRDVPASILYSSGDGQWAAGDPSFGIVTSFGTNMPGMDLLAMGAQGEVVYRDHAIGRGAIVRELNGHEYVLSDSGLPNSISVIGEGQAIWEEGGELQSYGMPDMLVLEGVIKNPKAILINGVWWISYSVTASPNIVVNGFVVFHPIHNGPDQDEDQAYGFKPFPEDNSGVGGRPRYPYDYLAIDGQPPTLIRWIYSHESSLENPGDIRWVDVDTDRAALFLLGPGKIVPGVAILEVDDAGTRSLTSTGYFDVGFAAEEAASIPIRVWPTFPVGGGRGRIVHPMLGAFDYEVKPDEWVNIDADAIIPPVWSSTRTLTSAANVLWTGNIRDVVVEERWKALGGLAMPASQLRMLLAIWTTPIDPDVGYVQWFPNYITQVGFKVLPVNLQAGSGGITFDDVINYLDENDDLIGWMTAPVTFTLKLVERI